MTQSPFCLDGNLFAISRYPMKKKGIRLPLPPCSCAARSFFNEAEMLDTAVSHEKILCIRHA